VSVTYDWRVVRPLAAYNYVCDPSFEADPALSPWALRTSASGGNSARVTPNGYRGAYALRLPAGATTQSGDYCASQTVAITNTSDYAVLSAWMFLNAADAFVGIKAFYGGLTYQALADPTKVGSWQRVSLPLGSLGISATSVVVYAYSSAAHALAGDVLWDAFQLEDGTALSTYLDGDQDGCRWIATPGLSASLRDLACRSGGVEVSIQNYVTITGMKGVGTPPWSHITLPRGLAGGSVYQRSLRLERPTLEIDALKVATSDLDSVMNDLGQLQQLFSPDLTSPQRPATLVYSPANASGAELEIGALFTGGLDYESMEGLTLQTLPLQFKCPEPFFSERKENAMNLATTAAAGKAFLYKSGMAAQGFNPIGAASRGGIRSGGWVSNQGAAQCLLCGSSGFGLAGTLVFDPLKQGNGNGGFFQISGGPVDNNVFDICQPGSQSPYVYFGGDFTHFYDGIGTNHAFANLVRYNLVTGALDQPWDPGYNVTSLTYDPTQDILYVGCLDIGAGTHSGPYAVSTPSGSPGHGATTWGATGVSNYGIIDMTVSEDGSLYVVFWPDLDWSTMLVYRGPRTSASWSQIGSAPIASLTWFPACMVWGPDGCLYLGGNFDSISPGSAVYGLARFNGKSWQPLGGRTITSALAGTLVYNMAFDPQGRLHIAGKIKEASSSQKLTGNAESGLVCGYAIYSGNTLHSEGVYPYSTYADVDHAPHVFVSPFDGAVLVGVNDDRTPVHAVYAPVTKIDYLGTAPAPPQLRFAWPSASSAPTLLGGFRNERTGQGIYFRSLLVQPGETVTVTTTPGKARVASNLRPDLGRYVAGISDLETFVLLPGANWISVFSGATGATASVIWKARHLSVDGSGSAIPEINIAAL
jgi:hypothetical protein